MDFQVTVPVIKTDSPQMLAFGFANVAVNTDGTSVVDRQNDEITADDLERAAYDYVLRFREAGVEHKKLGVARLVESFFLTAEKLGAMLAAPAPEFKGAKWWVGFKIDDPAVWKLVESGELSCFSIGGSAVPVEI